MKTKKDRPHKKRFIQRLGRSIFFASILISTSLILGMWGYHHFEKMSWLDSYVNAAMILSGMGPLESPKTVEGKLFEGTYALFSGILFLVCAAVIFAPVLHHFFHKLHIEEEEEEGS